MYLNSLPSFKNDRKIDLKEKPVYDRPVVFANDIFVSQKKPFKTPVNFTGITKSIKKKLYDNLNQLKEAVANHNSSIAGSLPDNWLAKIPSDNISQVSKSIHEDFALASNDLLEPLKGISFDDYDFEIRVDYDEEFGETYLKIVSKQGFMSVQMDDSIDLAGYTIESSLKRNGIIAESESIDFKILGVGKNAVTYTFVVDDKKYVLKVYNNFYEHAKADTEYNGEIQINTHGILPESNRAFFLKNIEKESNFAEPYWADLKANYMICAFVDADNLQMPKNHISNDSVGINFTDDYSSNFVREPINDYKNRLKSLGKTAKSESMIEYVIDYGGLAIDNDLLAKNKTARFVHKKIKRSSSQDKWSDTWDSLFKQAKDNKIPNSSDVMLGLASFLPYLTDDQIQKRLQLMLITSKKQPELNKVLSKSITEILCAPFSHFSCEKRKAIMSQLEYSASDSLLENLITDHFNTFKEAGIAVNLYELVKDIPTANEVVFLKKQYPALKPSEQKTVEPILRKMLVRFKL